MSDLVWNHRLQRMEPAFKVDFIDDISSMDQWKVRRIREYNASLNGVKSDFIDKLRFP